jgi:hypothetical protein
MMLLPGINAKAQVDPDLWSRPNYAYGTYYAAMRAKALKLKGPADVREIIQCIEE